MKIPARPPSSAGGAAALPPERCLAKTWELPQRTLAGRTVEEHCRIAGAVAACLRERLNAVAPGLLPSGAELPALLHDVGKACPPFQKRLYAAVTDMGPDAATLTRDALAKADVAWEASVGGHGAVSRACLAGLGAPAAVARIVGAHHGRAVRTFADDAEPAGGPAWQTLRRQMCERLLGGRADWPRLDGWLERIVGGLTVTADWIASGPLFDNPQEDWNPLIERAVDEAGFRWPDIRPGLSFEDIFGFAPRPAQRALYEAVSGPGVFVLEAPMGLGKTEAALYAAYCMLEQKKSCGLYFALPTQLTSNRIHTRVNAFLSRILRDGQGALLLHGMAWLEHFLRQRMGQEAAPNQSWFARGRRGILAPFGVGTVDQALFSVLHVRHGALRSFGLAGKTVILDEVHSYDAYTGTILDALIEQLRAMRCTVIILSATLTARRRAAILPGAKDAPSAAYPLISAAPADGVVREIACEPGEPAETRLLHASEENALEEALQRAEAGERVLWIENTVAGAQERFRLLAGRAAAMTELPTGLLHSRFTPADRRRNEERWASFFHPQAEGRGKQGCIVVGTQVVEQSLDLDADFLVSRFCPTDMLLQRLGRLWRHGRRTARPASARREACLLHPSLEEAVADPARAFGASGRVYAPYVLCRSLELWHDRERVRLPDDIRPLLEATYAAREEKEPAVLAAWRELCRIRDMLRRQALLAQSDSVKIVEDTQARTRWQEREEVSVALLRGWDAASRRLTLANGDEVTLCLPQDAVSREERLAFWQKRQEVAAVLAENTVRVAEKRAPQGEVPRQLARWCRDDVRIAWLADDGSVLHADGTPLASAARYDARLGYVVL